MPAPEPDTSEYLTFAEKVARQAGEIMMEYFKAELLESQTKEDKTIVTIADTEINQLVADAIKEKFPTHSFNGEEGGFVAKESGDFVWSCDPIDGTLQFSVGIPICTFSLALLKSGEPIVAVIYDPHTDRMYKAKRSEGATCNDKPISVSSEKLVLNSRVDITVRRDTNPELLEVFNELIGLGLKVYIMKSSTYSGVKVADGSFVASITHSNDPHDAAAVKLIVEEAGGKVTNLRGEEQRYDQPIYGAIISNAVIHDQLINITKKALASEKE